MHTLCSLVHFLHFVHNKWTITEFLVLDEFDWTVIPSQKNQNFKQSSKSRKWNLHSDLLLLWPHVQVQVNPPSKKHYRDSLWNYCISNSFNGSVNISEFALELWKLLTLQWRSGRKQGRWVQLKILFPLSFNVSVDSVHSTLCDIKKMLCWEKECRQSMQLRRWAQLQLQLQRPISELDIPLKRDLWPPQAEYWPHVTHHRQ